jgi:hypothetical protein
MSKLGLEKIEPRDERSMKSSLFTSEEWEEIAEARRRGLTYKQIYNATGCRYRSLKAFIAACYYQRQKSGN